MDVVFGCTIVYNAAVVMGPRLRYEALGRVDVQIGKRNVHNISQSQSLFHEHAATL